jgi:hypothetical protein
MLSLRTSYLYIALIDAHTGEIFFRNEILFRLGEFEASALLIPIAHSHATAPH